MADVNTFRGNLTDDPVLRFTSNGRAVVNFTIATNKRSFNRQTNEWEDGETTFRPVTAWNALAENIAESLRKGMRVIVIGELGDRTYTTKDGNERRVTEVTAQDVGPSLLYAQATQINRVTPNRQGQQNQDGGGFPQQGGYQQQNQGGNFQPNESPWNDSQNQFGSDSPF